MAFVVAPPVLSEILGLAANLRGRATPEVMRPQAINHAGTLSRQIYRLELAVFRCSFRRRSRAPKHQRSDRQKYRLPAPTSGAAFRQRARCLIRKEAPTP